MTAPRSPLPIEVRRQAWDRLWRRLLAPLPDDRASPGDDDRHELGDCNESSDDRYDEEAA